MASPRLPSIATCEKSERADQLLNVLAGGAAVEAIRQAAKEQGLARSTGFYAPYRGILDTLARERESQEAFKHLASNAWALSVQETARRIAEQQDGLVEQQRHLASSALDTIKAFDINRGGDPLSNQLARAWVYETTVTLLAPALGTEES